MDIKSLTEIIGLVREKAPAHRIIIFGSTSLLASVAAETASAMGIEVTLDTDLFLEPDDAQLRASLDKIYGQDHSYHQATGYYADFVDLTLSKSFPEGWQDRLVPFPAYKNVFALSSADAAATKAIATAHSRLLKRLGRSSTDRGLKDVDAIMAIVKSGHADIESIRRLLDKVEMEPAMLVEVDAVIAQVEQRLTA